MLYRRPARRPIAPRAPRARRTPRGRGRRDHARLPWLIGTAALVVAAGVAVGILETTGGTTGGSTALSPVLPASFEVVYQVITSTTGTPSTTWEVLHSADPFDTSDLTYDANPLSGAKPVSGTVSTFDHLYDLASGSLTLVTDRQPGQGSGDQALVPELGDLQHRHLAAPTGGQRRVAGQMCSTFRFSEPPVGAITPQSGTDHDNLCLSPSGLELAEQWTYVGRVVLERTAVEVTIGGADGRISGPPAAPPPKEPAVTALRVGKPTQTSFLQTPSAPAGFIGMGSVQAVAYDPSNPTQISAVSTIWAFQRSGDVVTVEAGEGRYPWDDNGTPTSDLRLDGLGQAQSILKSGGPEIQVQRSGGQWVRIDGTVPVSYLTRYAGQLRLA